MIRSHRSFLLAGLLIGAALALSARAVVDPPPAMASVVAPRPMQAPIADVTGPVDSVVVMVARFERGGTDSIQVGALTLRDAAPIAARVAAALPSDRADLGILLVAWRSRGFRYVPMPSSPSSTRTSLSAALNPWYPRQT